MLHKMKIPAEKPRRYKSIHAESSSQSVRELVQMWRHLSAEQRATKGLSMPSSLLNLNKLKREQHISALQMRRRSSIRSRSGGHRSSVLSEKEIKKHKDMDKDKYQDKDKDKDKDKVNVINYKETPRTSNVTRISMDEGTNLCFHEPINLTLPANKTTTEVN